MPLQPVQDHVIGDGNALKICDYLIKSFPIRDVKGYFHVDDVDTRVIALKPIVIEMISDNCTMTGIF